MSAQVLHGTVDGYREGRCDCDPCLDAYLVWRKERRIIVPKVEERALLKGRPQSEHGTRNRYMKWGCRCEQCRAAAALRRRNARAKARERVS